MRQKGLHYHNIHSQVHHEKPCYKYTLMDKFDASISCMRIGSLHDDSGNSFRDSSNLCMIVAKEVMGTQSSSYIVWAAWGRNWEQSQLEVGLSLYEIL